VDFRISRRVEREVESLLRIPDPAGTLRAGPHINAFRRVRDLASVEGDGAAREASQAADVFLFWITPKAVPALQHALGPLGPGRQRAFEASSEDRIRGQRCAKSGPQNVPVLMADLGRKRTVRSQVEIARNGRSLEAYCLSRIIT
jgi:hypothetical protein